MMNVDSKRFVFSASILLLAAAPAWAGSKRFSDTVAAQVSCHLRLTNLPLITHHPVLDLADMPSYFTGRSHGLRGYEVGDRKGYPGAAFPDAKGVTIYSWDQIPTSTDTATPNRASGRACYFKFPSPTPPNGHVILKMKNAAGTAVYYSFAFSPNPSVPTAKRLVPDMTALGEPIMFPNEPASSASVTVYDAETACAPVMPASKGEPELSKDLQFRFAGMAQYLNDQRAKGCAKADSPCNESYAEKKQIFKDLMESCREDLAEFDPLASNTAKWYLAHLDQLPTPPTPPKKSSEELKKAVVAATEKQNAACGKAVGPRQVRMKLQSELFTLQARKNRIDGGYADSQPSDATLEDDIAKKKAEIAEALATEKATDDACNRATKAVNQAIKEAEANAQGPGGTGDGSGSAKL